MSSGYSGKPVLLIGDLSPKNNVSGFPGELYYCSSLAKIYVNVGTIRNTVDWVPYKPKNKQYYVLNEERKSTVQLLLEAISLTESAHDQE